MINILCFGDSNTFGTNPHGGRWPLEQRWTGILQRELGQNYRIIEEGCGGRTTVWEDQLELDKNGRTALRVALHSHRPLDLVVLMLGTNDLKTRFSLLPVDIAMGAEALGQLVEGYNYGPDYPVPKVLLVSPIHLGEGVEGSKFQGFEDAAVSRSKALAPLYQSRAEAHGWLFLDASSVAEPSQEDKLHMEPESHAALGLKLAQIIRGQFEQ